MVATMAAGYDGSGPYNGFNPLNGGLSMTGAMTNAAGGTDATAGGAAFEALFLVGFILFMLTLILNLVGDRFVQRVRQKY
jgi:phosphate transport system permease protein